MNILIVFIVALRGRGLVAAVDGRRRWQKLLAPGPRSWPCS